MKIVDLALFNLALVDKISLEQAKILKSLYNRNNQSEFSLASDTGLSVQIVLVELVDLDDRKIVTEKLGYYSVENLEEKISDLIRMEETEKVALYN